MSDVLPDSAVLEPGRAYWLAIPKGGPEIVNVETSDVLIVSMKLPFAPLPGMGYLGACYVRGDEGVSVAKLRAWYADNCGATPVVADSGSLSGLLKAVALGNATLGQVNELRDSALNLVRETVQTGNTLVRWLPWIIAGTATLGLLVVIVAHAKG